MSNLRIPTSLNISWGVTFASDVPELALATCEVVKVAQSKSNPKNAVAFIRHPNWEKQILVEPSLLPKREVDGNYEFAPEALIGFRKGGVAYRGDRAEPKATAAPAFS